MSGPVNGKDWKLRLVYRLAAQHCANFYRDGDCKGLDFDLENRGRSFFNPKIGGRCLLVSDQRCPYFEEAILPMEKRKEWPHTPEGKRLLDKEAFLKAARVYHEVFPQTVSAPYLPGLETMGPAEFEREMTRRLERDSRKCLVCGKTFCRTRRATLFQVPDPIAERSQKRASTPMASETEVSVDTKAKNTH